MNPGTERPSAGVLGLGIIGSRVARRLQDAGFPLAVWNRTRKNLEGLPQPEDTPADVAAKAGILQVFVSDDQALIDTVRPLVPVLGPHHVVLCHATVSPRIVRELAAEVSGKGAALLDMPFTGSRDAAAQGQITYYASGAPEALQRALPVLESSAKAVIPLGKIGRASAVKIATNIMAAAAAVSLAEAVNLLRTNGIDPSILQDVLATNAARSGITDLKLPGILSGDFAPRFAVRNMRKDLRLARQLTTDDQGALTTAMLGLYDRACNEGLGDEDFSAVVKVGTTAPAGGV